MNHADAIAAQAAEKYLLGELAGKEAEEFELHFFACEQCATDLESGAVLMENVRALVRERPSLVAVPEPVTEASTSKRWKQVLDSLWSRPLAATPAFAALALTAVLGYQSLVTIPRLRREVAHVVGARQLPNFTLLAAARGDGNRVIVPPGARFFALNFDPVWTPSFARYRCDVQARDGVVKTSVPVTAPAAGQPISLLLGRDDLPSGSYLMFVKGIASDTSLVDVARYAFSVE